MVRLVVALLALVALVGCSHEPPPYESRYTPSPAATAPSYPPPRPLPQGAKAVVLGDSWTQGFSAVPMDRGFMYLTQQAMGWTGPVLGADGTGYTKGKNGVGPYLERIEALAADADVQIAVLQGSINDAGSVETREFRSTVDRTIGAFKGKFPNATIVLVGPCPNSAPLPRIVRLLDDELDAAAWRNSAHYISCVQQEWIDAANVGAVIDLQTAHPSTAGHAYLAERLTKNLRALSSAPPVP